MFIFLFSFIQSMTNTMHIINTIRIITKFPWEIQKWNAFRRILDSRAHSWIHKFRLVLFQTVVQWHKYTKARNHIFTICYVFHFICGSCTFIWVWRGINVWSVQFYRRGNKIIIILKVKSYLSHVEILIWNIFWVKRKIIQFDCGQRVHGIYENLTF